jgi:dihydropyrimidinase/allantoinase
MKRCDLVILNGTVVLPEIGPVRIDLGVKNGTVTVMADSLRASDGEEVLDATNMHILPGAVDSHFHVGIYRPHSQDAYSESEAAVSGGVTTILSYFRTGSHYLNKVGPYREIFPEVLDLSRGNFWCDYGYHIAPMTTSQLDEVEWLVDQGVASFKFYMFYKGLNLAADSTRAREYTMAEDYDLGHLYELMVRVSEAARARGQRISLSLHCENPELIRVFIARVKNEGLTGLEAYSKARPPLTESLSIEEAGVLAGATRCPINLLHLSSRDAIVSANQLRRRNPDRDIALETTLHHLALNYEDSKGFIGKVNPPVRAREDQAALWSALLNGQIDTVVSDHACCMEESKQKDLWSALPGFGGTSLLYPVLLSEGAVKRGLPLGRVAELASTNPARTFGLYPRKGRIAVGSDADFSICDLQKTQTVIPALLHSAQDFTPFSGLSFTGWPVMTVLRGHVVFRDGSTQGSPSGRFLQRPVALFCPSPEAAATESHVIAGERP